MTDKNRFRTFVDLTTRMRRCTRCSELKSFDEFPGHKLSKIKKASWCKSCFSIYNKRQYHQNKDYYSVRHREWRKNRSEDQKKKHNAIRLIRYHATRNKQLETKYKIPLGSIERWMKEQDRKCPICARSFSKSVKAVLHHCHNTNHVYGLWCQECNFIEGAVKKAGNPQLLLKMYEIMSDHSLFYYTNGQETTHS